MAWWQKHKEKSKIIIKKLVFMKLIQRGTRGSWKINKRYKKYIIGKIVRDEKQKNFKETGIYETNIQRERREK